MIGFSTVTALGVAGYFGVKLDPIAVTAPTIILTLAIADSVHILVSALTLMREGNDKITALKESIKINFVPVEEMEQVLEVAFERKEGERKKKDPSRPRRRTTNPVASAKARS